MKKLVTILFIGFVLTACGFHLRGSYSLPIWFNQVYVDNLGAVNQDFAGELLKELRLKKISTVPSQAQARAVLNLIEDKLSRSVYSTDPDTGLTSSYQLRYQLKYEVFQVASPDKITGSFNRAENYEFDLNNLLGNKGQESELRGTLISEAVNNIFAHLSRRK